MVATALVVICVVAVSLQYFYIFINNLLYFRYYRNKNVKIVPIQYVMKTNKVTITGFIIGIIVLVFNIIIDIIVLDRALIYDNFFPQQSSNIESMIRYDFIEHYNIDSRVLIAFICIAIFALIGFIFCFIFALKGKNIIKKYGREMPTSTLAASFPFIDSGLYDKQGMHLGTNNMGNVVLWDQFKITSKRTNHNMFIIGTSGMGKTYLLKIIINHHIKMGRKVIVIDPEREYQELCTYYDGNWIDAGDASIGKINPLQILDNNFIDEIENTNSSPLSNHLRFLEQWFKTLYPDFNGREINLLTKYLKLLYHQFNISNNSDIKKINNNDFPILIDFYTLLEKEYKNNKNELLKEFMDLIATDFLNDGKYQGLWNGHTTIKFNNNFIVYDVYNLFDLDV